MDETLAAQHRELHTQYISQVAIWKREWLKESPPTELVYHLNDPVENTERRQKDWDWYVIGRATTWWKERGWIIIFGEPDKPCRFEPIVQKTDRSC